MIKKLFKFIFIFALVLMPVVAMNTVRAADPNDPCSINVTGINNVSSANQFCNANDIITRVLSIIFGIIALVAVLFIVVGGFRYITSAGNEKTAASARSTITYAVIGLVIAILAYTIVTVVANTLNSGAGTSGTGTGGTGTGTGGGGVVTTNCDDPGTIQVNATPKDANGNPTVTFGQGNFSVQVGSTNAALTNGQCTGEVFALFYFNGNTENSSQGHPTGNTFTPPAAGPWEIFATITHNGNQIGSSASSPLEVKALPPGQ